MSSSDTGQARSEPPRISANRGIGATDTVNESELVLPFSSSTVSTSSLSPNGRVETGTYSALPLSVHVTGTGVPLANVHLYSRLRPPVSHAL
eukprot:scaffold3134_cov414-Prasinococcus_capsulatus_cf.AAC.7